MPTLDQKQRIDYFLLTRGEFLCTGAEFNMGGIIDYTDFDFQKSPTGPILVEYVSDCFEVLKCEINVEYSPIYFSHMGSVTEILRRAFSRCDVKIRVYDKETVSYILNEFKPFKA